MKENLEIQSHYFQLAEEIYAFLKLDEGIKKIVIGISGESGSGKSITGHCLKTVFEKRNIQVSYLQMDDYFHLAPKENHQRRLTNIKNVGINEVNLNLLQSHIDAFRNNKNSSGPEVDFEGNCFTSKPLLFEGTQVLIVEGTYIPELKHIDKLLFIDIEYKKSRNQRIKRGREAFDPFIEEVLEIEFNLISKYKTKADIVINDKYQIEANHVKENKTTT